MIILKFLRRIYVEFAAFFLWLLSIIINKTIKREVYGEENIENVHKSGKNVIFCFWHNASHPCFYYYRNKKLCIIPINRIYGEVLARFAQKYKISSELLNIDGTPAERTETVIKLLKRLKSGYDIGIAVDGPPNEKLYDVKAGPLYIASKSRMPILPAGMYAKRGFTMWWRWDKYIIPLPFTKVVINLGKPIHIPKKLNAKDAEKQCKELGEKIHALTREAKEICLGAGGGEG